MARDIAFVAEKDTPEEAGETLREPRLLPEAPRSEGPPAVRDASPVVPAAVADLHDSTLEPPDVPEAPSGIVESAPDQQGISLVARAPDDAVSPPPTESADVASPEPPSPAEPEPEREPDISPAPAQALPAETPAIEPAADPGTAEPEQRTAPAPRTEAVERAFAEARAVPNATTSASDVDPTPVAPVDGVPEEPATQEPAPVASRIAPEPEPSEPTPAPVADAQEQGQEPTARQDDTPPSTGTDDDATPEEENNSTSFTSAVEGLFRPSETSSDDTHLITTGRRFNPTLSVPKPAPEAAEPPVETPPSSASTPWKHYLWTGARYAAYAVAGYLALVLLLIILFRFVNPPGSMLMLSKLLGGTPIDRTWVPFEAISPALARAVIVSEDSRFCTHRGIDMQAMRLALEEASRGSPRGASTISMQVTKNLFLWNAKSYLRKVIELPLTLVMEVLWPKKRILEVYLNVAEWGPGVFGAEAAARHHFDKPASKLTEREAALLAAALPNPTIRVASNPGPRTSRMARVIQARVRAFGSVARCVVGPPPPASPAAAKPKPPARTAPAAKPPAPKPSAKKPQQKQQSQEWAPTLRFGP